MLVRDVISNFILRLFPVEYIMSYRVKPESLIDSLDLLNSNVDLDYCHL